MMRRMFGMMPSDCVTIIKKYRYKLGLALTIESGPEGWTIIWADGSTTYKDVKDTAENNLQDAIEIAEDFVGKISEDSRALYDEYDEE